jgi:DnaK suppressor protein
MSTKTQSKVVSNKPQLKRGTKPQGRPLHTSVKVQRPDLDLDHFRSMLIEERKRLEEELEQVRNRHTDTDNALPEEGEGGDEDTADLASAMMDKEMDLSVEDEIEEILAQVDRAFQKFEEGTYGICDVSGKPIPANRLEAIPYATLTVECQSMSEA